MGGGAGCTVRVDLHGQAAEAVHPAQQPDGPLQRRALQCGLEGRPLRLVVHLGHGTWSASGDRGGRPEARRRRAPRQAPPAPPATTRPPSASVADPDQTHTSPPEEPAANPSQHATRQGCHRGPRVRSPKGACVLERSRSGALSFGTTGLWNRALRVRDHPGAYGVLEASLGSACTPPGVKAPTGPAAGGSGCELTAATPRGPPGTEWGAFPPCGAESTAPLASGARFQIIPDAGEPAQCAGGCAEGAARGARRAPERGAQPPPTPPGADLRTFAPSHPAPTYPSFLRPRACVANSSAFGKAGHSIILSLPASRSPPCHCIPFPVTGCTVHLRFLQLSEHLTIASSKSCPQRLKRRAACRERFHTQTCTHTPHG